MPETAQIAVGVLSINTYYKGSRKAIASFGLPAHVATPFLRGSYLAAAHYNASALIDEVQAGTSVVVPSTKSGLQRIVALIAFSITNPQDEVLMQLGKWDAERHCA